LIVKIGPSVRNPKNKLNKCSAVAKTGDRLATIDMGRKLEAGAVPFFLEGGELGSHLRQRGLGRGLSSSQVASRSKQPFGHNRHGQKSGGSTPLGWSWVPI